jgi:hypothetical protein
VESLPGLPSFSTPSSSAAAALVFTLEGRALTRWWRSSGEGGDAGEPEWAPEAGQARDHPRPRALRRPHRRPEEAAGEPRAPQRQEPRGECVRLTVYYSKDAIFAPCAGSW